MELSHWTIRETLARLTAREISAEELVGYCLNRIQRWNPHLRAFLYVAEQALEQARRVDQRRLRNEPLPPLAGIPVAVKDLFDTSEMDTTYGGRHIRHRPTVTATAVARLEDAGAIVIGKTNLHEYAFGTTNDNPHFGACANPWNPTKISGGSSGGSAAAVVAGMCWAALGTDTGGSIRIPAALCGCVGFKPTRGRISTYGVFPLAPSLDHVGPMTRSVDDAALLFDILAGYDPKDPVSVRAGTAAVWPLPTRRVTVIGLPKGDFFTQGHPDVRRVFDGLVEAVANMPEFRLTEVEIPHLAEIPQAQAVILGSEARYVHREWLAAAPELYGPDVLERLQDAARYTGSDYVAAKALQRTVSQAMDQLFASVDVILTPTTPIPAQDIGQQVTEIAESQMLVRAALTRWTNLWNFTGLPAASVPAGWTSEGLPLGVQVVGGRFADRTVLAVAAQLEGITGFPRAVPDERLDPSAGGTQGSA